MIIDIAYSSLTFEHYPIRLAYIKARAEPARASHVEGQVGRHQLVGRLSHGAATLHGPEY